jgi:hypothetical protein
MNGMMSSLRIRKLFQNAQMYASECTRGSDFKFTEYLTLKAYVCYFVLMVGLLHYLYSLHF